MSSNTYTMKLVVDDTAVRQLEKRLQNIMGLKPISGTGSSSGSKGDLFGNLGKLGAIAVGVAALVKGVQMIVERVVASSPALQATLKIFDTAITLIFRPIGDFFAFTLRPIAIIFLTKVALPFYRLTAPMMRFFGSKVGNTLAGNWNSNLEGLDLIIQGRFGELWDKARVKMEQDWDNLTAGFNKWASGIKFPSFTKVSLLLERQWNHITSGFNKWVKDNIPKLPDWKDIPRYFLTWVRDQKNKLPTWDSLTKSIVTFFSSFKVPDVVQEAVKTFFDFIKKLSDWINGLPEIFKNWLGIGTNTQSQSQNMQQPVSIYISPSLQASQLPSTNISPQMKKNILDIIMDALKSI